MATTFSTPGSHTYTVPDSVTHVTVDVKGASGGDGGDAFEGTAGGSGEAGGRVAGDLPVTGGETLNVHVGGSGGNGSSSGGSGGSGGSNGGGPGGDAGNSRGAGGGGGGASDVRQGGDTLDDRVAVGAGGAGGGGANTDGDTGGDGGQGGADTGEDGDTGAGSDPGDGGGGGTQSAGGTSSADNGSKGEGGDGNDSFTGSGGGGGGSGLFGGAGGVGGGDDGGGGGGGGGSNYDDDLETVDANARGTNTGNGEVTLTPIAKATGSKATMAATATGADEDTTTVATASNPTLSATPTVGHSALGQVAQASKPILGAVPRAASADTEAKATASNPTLSATAREPLAYGDVPLLDAVPLVEDMSQVVRWDEIELKIRASQATLDAIVRSVETNTGKYEQLNEPTGGFTTRDTTGGDNTFRYAPRYAEQPFIKAQDVLADSYVERPAAQDASFYEVSLVFKFASNVTPRTGLIDESKGSTDWLFETHAGTIATPNVERNVEAESQAGALGFVLDVFLDADQAHALRVATGRQGAVAAAGGERDDVLVLDNSPDESNTLVLKPRDTAQMAEQRYVVRDTEFTRLDPEGTHYVATVELLPAAVGARGTAGHGKAGEYKAGET